MVSAPECISGRGPIGPGVRQSGSIKPLNLLA
jgi:hypothetical protein